MLRIKNDGSNMIDEMMLDHLEAITFIKFLQEEVERHLREYKFCIWEWENSIDPVRQLAYHSSALRHQEDIEFTNKAINRLISKHKIDWKELKC